MFGNNVIRTFSIIFLNIYFIFQIGDLTEDPQHPKTFWPSDVNCPECYTTEMWPDSNLHPGLLIEGRYAS